MSGAVSLNKIGVVKSTQFSTEGLPLHFCGNREADTVFVMLNPGENACMADAMFLAKTASYNRGSVIDFIDSYKRDKTKVSLNRAMLVDPFDVKQAAFLKPWKASGIAFPKQFPSKCCSYWDAVENCLNQKLQLELLPYSSSSFRTIDKKCMSSIIPFLENVFDEVIAKERRYVIFGSNKFADLFDYYNDYCKRRCIHNQIIYIKKRIKDSKKPNTFCSKIEVCYNGKTFNAIIAHSFFSYGFINNYSSMEHYGTFCYNQAK